MAYVDYIHCADCDCKLIYDGCQTISDRLESRWGDMDAPDYTVKLYCPDCQKQYFDENARLRQQCAELEEAAKAVASVLDHGDLDINHDAAQLLIRVINGAEGE